MCFNYGALKKRQPQEVLVISVRNIAAISLHGNKPTWPPEYRLPLGQLLSKKRGTSTSKSFLPLRNCDHIVL